MKKICLLAFALGCAISSMAGVIDTLKVHSDAMNRDINVLVVRPSSTIPTPASAKAKKGKVKEQAPIAHCPVVYLLHGAYGNEYAWPGLKPNLADIADEMQMFYVTLAAQNSWYWDSPIDKSMQYETFVTKELIPWVDAHYPTIADRTKRAITGLSMGGHGALYLASRHTDLFGAAASMSGGVDIRPFPQNWDMPNALGEMAANKQSWDEHTVMETVRNLKNGDLAIYFDCGESDFFLEVNKALHARLLALGIDHDFTTRPGGHTGEYWANSFDYHMLFFKKYFNR